MTPVLLVAYVSAQRNVSYAGKAAPAAIRLKGSARTLARGFYRLFALMQLRVESLMCIPLAGSVVVELSVRCLPPSLQSLSLPELITLLKHGSAAATSYYNVLQDLADCLTE